MTNEQLLQEIKENLSDVLQHSSDCSDSDDYRKYIPWLISELEKAWEREKIMKEALKDINKFDLSECAAGFHFIRAREALEKMKGK